ncbi:MAG: energy transducer TonB [Bacteriovoracia bacterium]
MDRLASSKTEVIQINPAELDRIKQAIQKRKDLIPLLKQEMHEKYRSKEAPKNANVMGAFNQIVPEEMVAGAQKDAPQEGSQTAKSKTTLAKLGLGNTISTKAQTSQQQEQEVNQEAESSKPFRPRGFDSPNLKKGHQNLLNAAENEYYSFFVRFEEPIIRNWFFLMRQNDLQIRQEIAGKKIRPGAELPVTVEFTIDRAGNFHSINLVTASGIRPLDEATLNAVRKLESLPNPPPGLFEGGQYFTYRLQFVVLVQEGPIFNSNPDLNWY